MQVVPAARDAGTPFKLNSLPQQVYTHPGWAGAERQVLASIDNRRRVLLLGKPGTGKSLLLHHLSRMLRGRGVNVWHLCTGDLPDSPAEADVLLVDEAALLAPAQLERLLRLPNALVLAGLPSLPERLTADAGPFDRVTLEPLPPEEVARFVIGQLAASGRPRAMFTPEALVKLAHESNGLLRLVAMLAGAALFFAEQRGAVQVTTDDVAEAMAMRTLLPEEGQQEAGPSRVAGGEVARPEPRRQSATPRARDVGPSKPVVVGGRWKRPVGLALWMGASLGVIGIATIVARDIEPISPLARMATLPVPDPAPSPTAPPATPLPPAPAIATVESDGPAARPRDASTEVTVPAVSKAMPAMVVPLEASATVLFFTGPILNDTMKQGGQLSLQLRIRGAHGPAAAMFHASQGLIGSGMLTGEVGSDGRMTLSGRLMMGRNPFNCTLQATLEDGQLVGAATFVRASSGAAAHSSFKLSRL